jgi:hypothetical protein
MKRSVNEKHLIKFNNYVMRNGKRAATWRFLSKVLLNEFNNPYTLNERTLKANYSWKSIYLTINYLIQIKSKTFSFSPILNESIIFNHRLSLNGKLISCEWDLESWFFKNMYSLLPIFSFYIYKVDKKIFKNTRGKSGKFTFIWKYVTSYKRLFLVMHWLSKELKVKPGRNLEERLSALISSLVNSPKTTWIYKVKKFSNIYVYKNSRQSLASNYRTVTK